MYLAKFTKGTTSNESELLLFAPNSNLSLIFFHLIFNLRFNIIVKNFSELFYCKLLTDIIKYSEVMKKVNRKIRKKLKKNEE